MSHLLELRYQRLKIPPGSLLSDLGGQVYLLRESMHLATLSALIHCSHTGALLVYREVLGRGNSL